jgi:uncharacterized protein (TIGR02996 family)
MHTDDSFLLAIEAEPADRVRRLVYADWLDDRHDPRAELVRVEEEMRTLPVFADRFWELKPRRNELRAVAGGDWCARMRYGTECEPVFRHGIPDGWRDRWRLIREFTERWHRIPMPDVGGRATEIAEAETRLKRELPPSVREWIAFAHDVEAADTRRRELLYSFLYDSAGAFGLMLREQAVIVTDDDEFFWGIPFCAFENPDPPVVPCEYTHPILEIPNGEWCRLSDFVLRDVFRALDGRVPRCQGLASEANLQHHLSRILGAPISIDGSLVFEQHDCFAFVTSVSGMDSRLDGSLVLGVHFLSESAVARVVPALNALGIAVSSPYGA